MIFENTGAPGVLHRVVLDAPTNSQVVVTGIASGDESMTPILAITKALLIRSVIYSAVEKFAQALALIEGARVTWAPLITGHVGLESVTQAFADLSDPERHAKILIAP